MSAGEVSVGNKSGTSKSGSGSSYGSVSLKETRCNTRWRLNSDALRFKRRQGKLHERKKKMQTFSCRNVLQIARFPKFKNPWNAFKIRILNHRTRGAAASGGPPSLAERGDVQQHLRLMQGDLSLKANLIVVNNYSYNPRKISHCSCSQATRRDK